MSHVNRHPCLPIPSEQGIPLMKSHPLVQASHQCQKDMWCNLLCATEMKYCFSQGQYLHYVICDKDRHIKRTICIKLYLAVWGAVCTKMATSTKPSIYWTHQRFTKLCRRFTKFSRRFTESCCQFTKSGCRLTESSRRFTDLTAQM